MKKNNHTHILSEEEKVEAVHREYHTRRPGAYIIQDKMGMYLIMAQKLSVLCDLINNQLLAESDWWEKVSQTSLYDVADRKDQRTGGWTKGRWRVEKHSLESAGDNFEEKRKGGFKSVMICGDLGCYKTTACI